MKRIIIWGLTAGLMLSFSSTVQAQGKRGAFIDDNADGLGDEMAQMHRRGGRMAGEVRERVLTVEQQVAIGALVGELKADEATREDIHAAIEGQLANWGVELPEKPESIARGGQGKRFSLLTDEQRAIVDALVSDLRANDATSEEIHRAVKGQLSDLGVELPERPEGKDARVGFATGKRSGVREGASEWTVRRRVANRMDSKSIETMMMQTQGKGIRY